MSEVAVNRFVVLREEEYDQYTVEVAYPIETPLSREDLLGEIRTFFDNLTEKGRLPIPDYYPPRINDHLDLGGTGFMVYYNDLTQVKGSDDGKSYYWDYHPPTILTVDEWYDRGIKK
jgi:hypothetical protein